MLSGAPCPAHPVGVGVRPARGPAAPRPALCWAGFSPLPSGRGPP